MGNGQARTRVQWPGLGVTDLANFELPKLAEWQILNLSTQIIDFTIFFGGEPRAGVVPKNMSSVDPVTA